MKVYVVVDRNRDLTVNNIMVLKKKPKWEPDFYESFHECEVQDD